MCCEGSGTPITATGYHSNCSVCFTGPRRYGSSPLTMERFNGSEVREWRASKAGRLYNRAILRQNDSLEGGFNQGEASGSFQPGGSLNGK